jgi:hypothetical protein
MSYFGKDDPRLEDIRRRGQDAARDEDWAGLRAMETELRVDAALWIGIWAPISSYAAWKCGEPNPRVLLEEAIANGYEGSGDFDHLLAEAFGADTDWPELAAAIRANVPAPSIEILDWPASRPTRPLQLFRLAKDREALLRERIPPPEGSAWETAIGLLGWVAGRWAHANAHVDEQDAVEILKLVDEGERFACVEYTTVLCHALNASEIPARFVDVRTEEYHVGLGKGHAVSEAWIDGLDAWVVLDGQNGTYWIDEDGTPLGVPALQDWFRSGKKRAVPVVCGPNEMSDHDADFWWRYFAHVSSTGGTWSENTFVPVFQSKEVVRAEVLLRDRAEAYPDLAEMSIGVTGVEDRPAIRPRSEHPYASGFEISMSGATQVTIALDAGWPVPRDPAGVHEAHIATVTPYTTLAPSTVVLRIS